MTPGVHSTCSPDLFLEFLALVVMHLLLVAMPLAARSVLATSHVDRFPPLPPEPKITSHIDRLTCVACGRRFACEEQVDIDRFFPRCYVTWIDLLFLPAHVTPRGSPTRAGVTKHGSVKFMNVLLPLSLSLL